jgi:hypothetical protein
MENEIKEKIEERVILTKVTCQACGFTEELTEEDLGELVDIAFKHNPDARGDRIQAAYDFSRGLVCLGPKDSIFDEPEMHMSLFEKEYILKRDETAKKLDMEENNLLKLSTDIKENQDTINELYLRVKSLEEKISANKAQKEEIEISRPQKIEEFRRYTGTDKYKKFI